VLELDEPRLRQEAAPRSEIVVDAVATAIPALVVRAARVGAEQDAPGPERIAQLAKHARQLLGGDMEQRGIREDSVEESLRQIQREEVLLPHGAPAGGARHRDEARGSVEPDRAMAEPRERDEIAARPATEIEHREGRRGLDASQQRRDVLAHVVIARAVAKLLRVPVVVRERPRGDLAQIARLELHPREGDLPFRIGTAGPGAALAAAAAFFWLFCAASCFLCRSLAFGDLSPMGYRLSLAKQRGDRLRQAYHFASDTHGPGLRDFFRSSEAVHGPQPRRRSCSPPHSRRVDHASPDAPSAGPCNARFDAGPRPARARRRARLPRGQPGQSPAPSILGG